MERGVGIAAFNLGRLLEAQGREKEAKEAFAKAEELEEVEWEEEEGEKLAEEDESED